MDFVGIATTACVEHQASQKPQELADFLAMLAAKEPKILVELGAGYGGSLYAWCAVVPTVISVEVNPVYIHSLHGATMLQRDTHDPDTIPALRELLGGQQIDCVFIDANHAYDDVLRDYEDYRPLVRPGGLVALHDIVTFREGEHVPKVWSEIKDDTAVEIIHPAGGQWGGIGVMTV